MIEGIPERDLLILWFSDTSLDTGVKVSTTWQLEKKKIDIVNYSLKKENQYLVAKSFLIYSKSNKVIAKVCQKAIFLILITLHE